MADLNFECKVGVIKSQTLPEVSNETLIPMGISTHVVGKIPVVLAEPVVQVDIESEIKLEEPAFEIKRIKKNLFITQCKLIDTDCGKTGKLFLSGFVRKNIEFATIESTCEEDKSVSGKIRHTTVNVPFTVVTKVNLITPPQLSKRGNTVETASSLAEKKGTEFCGQKIHGSDPCEQFFEHTEVFNEKIFCELVEAKFFEDDILVDPKPLGCEENSEFTFDKVLEKMVILIRLKILQKQQVELAGINYSGNGKAEKNQKY